MKFTKVSNEEHLEQGNNLINQYLKKTLRKKLEYNYLNTKTLKADSRKNK